MNNGAPGETPMGTAQHLADQAHAGLEGAAMGHGDAAPLKLEEFLPYRLNVVASLVSQALSRIYADRYGIGVPEWRGVGGAGPARAGFRPAGRGPTPTPKSNATRARP